MCLFQVSMKLCNAVISCKLPVISIICLKTIIILSGNCNLYKKINVLQICMAAYHFF